MESEDIKKDKAAAEEEKKVEEARRAIEEASQEEIEDFAENRPNSTPNGMWGQSGTWWILGIAAILIIFLVIWVCFLS